MPSGGTSRGGGSGVQVEPSGGAGRDASGEFLTIQSDVERLIEIAAQLFGAIEHEIRDLEAALSSTSDGRPWTADRTRFKEQLIRSSLHLDSSLRQVARDLGQGMGALSHAPAPSHR